MSVFRAFGVARFLVRLRSAKEGVEVSVDPHHPDGAGGWDALSEYLAGALAAIATGAMALSIVVYARALEEDWPDSYPASPRG